MLKSRSIYKVTLGYLSHPGSCLSSSPVSRLSLVSRNLETIPCYLNVRNMPEVTGVAAVFTGYKGRSGAGLRTEL